MTEYAFERRVSKNFGEIREPLIPVKLIGPRLAVSVMMLVDSGADISLIPHSLGRLIGLPFSAEDRKEVRGLEGGSVAYLLSHLKLRIADNEISARVGWAMIDEVPLILGRLDVFRRFTLEFREHEDRILIEPVPDL